VLALVAAGCGGGMSDPSTVDVLRVEGMDPAPRTVAAAPDGPITIRFDRPLRAGAIVNGGTLHVFARWSGTIRGAVALSADRRAVTLTPDRALGAGESVTVMLSRDVRGEDGTTLGPLGWSAQFWTRARPASATFTDVQRLSTRPAPGTPSRAYGGIASDLDGDGAPDLAIVNEDTADLVVFLNRGAAGFVATGERHPLGRRASPSEPADFDRDGNTDMAVANITDGTVSVLLGRGDGGFRPPQVIAVGATPRGIAVLDVDGDADADIATANFGSDDIAILVNDAGVFRAGTRVDSGARGEWALAAADMDEDGALDLVVGARADQRIVVLRNAGGGAFAPTGSQDAGGGPWMLVTGDLDRDGHEDVATVNGLSNTAAVLRGTGHGTLGTAAVYAIDPFALASDLGDLDGDGDLDWITSSYSGDWRLFENRDGTLVIAREIAPRTAASCALAFDADGDGDLDLALIDEEADEVTVTRNDTAR
jgi:hypothetical protein